MRTSDGHQLHVGCLKDKSKEATARAQDHSLKEEKE